MKSPSTIQDTVGLRAPLLLAFITLLGFGLLYASAGTVLGRALFPHEATGSLLSHDGRVIGSKLVAQPFNDARYFQPRPSAANYDPMAAAGSNLARSNPALQTRIDALTKLVSEREGIAPAKVPAELVTQSGSGLDPDLSLRAIEVQVARVARARGLPVATVQQLVAQQTAQPRFGVLGPARINVLKLNLGLDALPR